MTVNSDLIRARFSREGPEGVERINAASRDAIAPGKTFVDAAVLIPLLVVDNELDVLLTRRAKHLTHHPGQVSFPGGRKEPSDESLVATALRETQEETGIAPEYVEIVGHLPRMYTISAYDVAPVIGLVRPGYTLSADPDEVDGIFSVPLSYLVDDRHRIDSDVHFKGTRVPMVEWHYEGERIWGATAAMIRVFIQILKE